MTNDRLTVVTLTEKDDEEQALVCYYYNFEDPEITAVPAPGVQTSTEVDVTLASSIKSHDIYYTTDGTEPPATLTNATTTAQLYTGLISIDKSTYIKARTYTKDGKASSSVFTMLYSIPTEATEGSAGTTVTYRQIAKGENKLWTAKDSPYIINSNLTVASGGTLEIEPGVTVKLGTNVSINVSGSLNAVGSEDKTIRFLGSSADRWGGLTLNPTTFGTDSVSLENAEIGGSSSGVVVSAEKQRFNTDLNGLYIHDNREGLKFSTKSAKGFAINNSRFVSNDIGLSLVSPENTVTGCEFNKNATAISVTAADNVITNSTVTNSTKTGILNKDSSGTKVNDCVIKGNTKSVEATSANSADYVLDFTNNDWGNITEGIIRNRIVDKSTKTEYPTVDITGYKADLSGFVPKCEFDTVLDADRTSNTLTLSNAATAKTVKLTAAKLETTYSDNIFFAVAMYDETGALVRVGTATQGLPDSSSDIVNLTMTETIPNADISRIAKIKVFAMSPTQLTPFAGTVIIE